MPSITAPATVLVTGANGFIAAHCVAHLLQANFKVVGTVRSSAKADAVLQSHFNHPNLRLEIVPDVTTESCFNTAVEGCDAILHLAAPFGYAYKDFEEELLLPSINGTLAVCEAASQEESVQRVVLTSSFASVYDARKGLNPEKTYTEEDWCPLTYEDGKNAAITPVAYRASKVLAEKTAWNFMEEKHPKWDLVTLCPGMVFGALLPGAIESIAQLNTSNAIVWSLIDAKSVPDTKAPIWTSATALAAAHTSALVTAAASGERFLVTNGTYDFQELADIIHASSDTPVNIKIRVPKGESGRRLAESHYKVDNSKGLKALALEEPTLENTVIPLIKQLAELETITAKI
ncbi:Nad dependent epimerase [Coleophoma crateriformis]|uniref:Nad dependent epimerase n=1 Tax=Coleophoma crateriformis TaxID=565419 RepID=A0A3D8QHH1_9HELO|nr:Nad dependent epimerase [Coleophoma crateriformis]